MGGVASSLANFLSPLPARLFRACQDNDANLLRSLLSRTGPVDAFRDDDGLSLLMVCAKCNAVDAARVLLNHPEPAQVDLRHAQHMTTALMFAAGWGCTATLRLLLERGANPSLQSVSGMCALDHARKEGMVEACRILESAMCRFQGQLLWERSTSLQLLSGMVLGTKAKMKMREKAGGQWQTVYVTLIVLNDTLCELAIFPNALTAVPERVFYPRGCVVGRAVRNGDLVTLDVQIQRGPKPAKDQRVVPLSSVGSSAPSDVKKIRFGSSDADVINDLDKALASSASGTVRRHLSSHRSAPPPPPLPLPPPQSSALQQWLCPRCTLLNVASECEACAYSPSTLSAPTTTAPVAQVHSLVPHDSFICPLTAQVFNDPVICLDGYSYERQAIMAFFASGRRVSPVTGQPLPDTTVVSNEALRRAIRAWQDSVPTANVVVVDLQ